MMFESSYEELQSSEKQTFRKVISSLLCHTFILSHEFDGASGERRFNPEYSFANKYYELLEDYLEYAGITLSRDSAAGIIYIQSFPAEQRARLDKMTTIICYTLRLIYAEDREQLSLSSVVSITVGDLTERLETMGLFRSKIAKTQIRDSLRTLIRHRLIAKGPGELDDKSTKLVILPSIQFVVSEEKLSSLARIARQDESEAEEETEDEEAD